VCLLRGIDWVFIYDSDQFWSLKISNYYIWSVEQLRAIHNGLWWVALKEREHLEFLGLYGRTAFKWSLKIYRTGSGLGQVECSCEDGNEPSRSTKGAQFVDHSAPRNTLQSYQLTHCCRTA
jgi:hypothetical protein